jgi:hypothetical protein
MSLLAGDSFTNFWFQFESILKVFQKRFQIKTEKKKRERKEKEEKAPGTDSSPQAKTAHGPFLPPPEPLSSPSPLGR